MGPGGPSRGGSIIDSKWLPPQLYQMRSYRNPSLLSTCLLPYANFGSDSVWIRSATFSFVISPVGIGLYRHTLFSFQM